MKISYKIIIIILVLILQFFWLATPRVGPHSYRNSQRIGAAMAWLEHPSPATKGVLDREDKLLAMHERKMEILTAVICWVLDMIGVYLFLSYGHKRRPQTP